MALIKTLTMPFDGATWADLRRLVDAAPVADDTPVQFAWDDDEGRELPRPIALEVSIEIAED